MSPAFIFFCVLLLSAGAKAQTTSTISGTVIDSVGNPLPGATITNKQKHASTATDANGKFNIAANEGEELEISEVLVIKTN